MIRVSLEVNVDHEAARLNREATAAKQAKDWPRAINLLRQVKARAGDAYEDTRLALFLQQAGRFDEAMAEFQWLLDRAEGWVEGMVGHQPVSVRQYHLAGRLAQLHDKIRLACERGKRADLAQRHSSLHEHYSDKAEKLRATADRDRKARIEESSRRTKAGLAELAARLKK